MKYLPIVALVVLAFAAGWSAKPTGPNGPGPTVSRVDTVPPAYLLEEVEGLREERDGLRARVAGLERRPPRIILRTDTIVEPPDTVFLPLLSMSHRGRLTIPVLVSDSVGWRPEIWRGFDVRDCDDGWAVQDGALVCNRARLGHLGVVLGSEVIYDGLGALTAFTGLEWQPSYRSPWQARVTVGTDGVTRGTITRQWRFF